MKGWITTCLLLVNCLITVSALAEDGASDNFFLIESYDSTLVTPEDHRQLVAFLLEYHQANDDTTRLGLLNSISSLFQKFEYKRDYAGYGLQLANTRSVAHDPVVEEIISRLKIDLLRNQAMAYKALAIRDLAFETLFNSLRIAEKLNDSTLIGTIAIDLAINYLGYDRLDQAMEFLKMANTHLLNSADYESKAYSAYMFGILSFQQGDFDLSVEAFEVSIQACNQIENIELRGISSNYQANVYVAQGNFNKAVERINAAITDFEKIDNNAYLSQAYYVYSSIYFKQQKWSESRKYTLMALEFAEKGESLEEAKNANERLYLIALKKDNYKRAFEYYQAYVVIRDSISGITNAGQIAEQKVKYDYEQQALRDSVETAATLKIEHEQVESKTRESRLLWVGLLIILVFAAILFQRFRISRKQKLQLEEDQIKLNTLNLELNESNEKLKELDSLKSEFFTNVSHEFRTPLTVISGMARQMMNNPEKNGVQGGELILASSSSLLSMVDQILQLRKLETGILEAHYAMGDVINFISYTVVSLKSYAEDQAVSLSFSSTKDELITGYDKEKIQSIITNLISNSIKYNRKDGSVNCSITVVAGYYEICIEDTGIGIAQDKIPHIFDQFYRVDNSETREREGTGVGLALVKRLVELMDGTIHITSDLNVGTTITVNLPTIHVKEQQVVKQPVQVEQLTEEIADATADKTKENILIIEDNAQVRAYLNDLLEYKYNISFAANGQLGIEQALKTVPDIIISDVMMPRKSGFDVVEELKNNIVTSHIPIILLTAKADVESKLKGLEKGADAYLPKPFDPKELERILKNFLKLKTRIQERYAKIYFEPSDNDEHKPEDDFIKRFHGLIENNLDDTTYDVTTLCKELGMSRSQVHNKMKAITGLSTSNYIQKYKVEKAKILLIQEHLNVAEVAYALGFNTPNYFSRVFSSLVGISPASYKASQKTNP